MFGLEKKDTSELQAMQTEITKILHERYNKERACRMNLIRKAVLGYIEEYGAIIVENEDGDCLIIHRESIFDAKDSTIYVE